MPDERKYRDDEVAEIFEAAAATRGGSNPNAVSTAEGMTLTELQAIGGEVGLSPTRIAEAAAKLDLRRDAVRRNDFGLPVSVGRTVDLPRAPTDLEWEMLVAELRATFNARGREESHGGIREWRNGNLHAYLEPTATGHRLRLVTTKGNALAFNRLGLVNLVVAVIAFLMLFAAGQLPGELMIPLIFGAIGSAAVGYNALRLPGWAQEREEQMERIGARAQALLATPPQPEGEPRQLATGSALAGEAS